MKGILGLIIIALILGTLLTIEYLVLNKLESYNEKQDDD